jgi:hypothetical protein
MGAIKGLPGLFQVLEHGINVVLDIAKINKSVAEETVCCAFCECLGDVCFGSEKTQHMCDLCTGSSDPSQHVSLICLAQDQDKIVDRVNFQLHRLHIRDELVNDAIQQHVHDPVGCDLEKILEGLHAAQYMANVTDCLAVDAQNVVPKDEEIEIDGFLLWRRVGRESAWGIAVVAVICAGVIAVKSLICCGGLVSKGKIANIARPDTQEQVRLKNFALFPVVAHQNVLDGQGMDREDAGNVVQVFRRRIAAIKPKGLGSVLWAFELGDVEAFERVSLDKVALVRIKRELARNIIPLRDE